MTPELDALLVRSLPELNEAGQRLEALNEDILKLLGDLCVDWAATNGWKGDPAIDGYDPWLAPPEWAVGAEDARFHLYFALAVTGESEGDAHEIVSLTGAGRQQIGFWLHTDSARAAAWKKLWREHAASATGLPLYGADFFLPITVDREALAAAILDGAPEKALEPVRETLDLLPQHAAALDRLAKAIAAAAAPAA